MFHKHLVKKLLNIDDNSTLEMISIPKYVHIACGGICLRLSIWTNLQITYNQNMSRKQTQPLHDNPCKH